MNKIKEFLEFLFSKEQEAINCGYFKDKIEEYNKISLEIKLFMNDETVGFGLPQKLELKSDRYYKTKENAIYPTPRQLFKISHYQNQNYNDLWACYVSVANSYMDTKRINDCFIVAEINGELKIIAKFGPDIDQPKWKFYGGDRALKINELGKLLNIERYLEPIDDAWSMEQYKKEI